MSSATRPCRCGYTGDGPHPCHARSYTCRAPASIRFYDPRLVSLAGAQFKAQVVDTWACDDCWAEHLAAMAAARAAAEVQQ